MSDAEEDSGHDHGISNLGGRATYSDTAHVPGLGDSPDRTCASCLFMKHWWNATVYGRCSKAAQFRRRDVEDMRKIPLDTQSCKYFAERPAEIKPWEGLYADHDDVGDAGEHEAGVPSGSGETATA